MGNTKICTGCGRELPATAEYFYKMKRGKFGLMASCKDCEKACKVVYRAANKAKIAAHKKEYQKEYMAAPAEYSTYANQLTVDDFVVSSKGILKVVCTYCGQIFSPSNRAVRNRISAINGKKSEGSECRLYCSDACKTACPTFGIKSDIFSKENQANQILGSTREVLPEFRQMVLKNADYKCSKCGSDEAGLHVHHIEGYTQSPMTRFDLDNVIVVCKECHKEIHATDGCRYMDYQCGIV